MHFNTFFLAFCLSLTVSAKGHKNGTTTADVHKGHGKHHQNKNSEDVKCAEMKRLTGLTDLVNNSTKLADFEAKHHLTADQMQKLKDKAANATTELTQLKSNTTLVNACVTIDAAERTKAECKMMQRLDKIIKLESNTTALQALQSKHNLTDAQLQKIKDEAANATAKLTKLQSNSTLVAACKNLKAAGGKSGSGSGLISESTSSATKSFGSTFGILANVLFAAFLGGFSILLA